LAAKALMPLATRGVAQPRGSIVAWPQPFGPARTVVVWPEQADLTAFGRLTARSRVKG
jgi:hypothetical protein